MQSRHPRAVFSHSILQEFLEQKKNFPFSGPYDVYHGTMLYITIVIIALFTTNMSDCYSNENEVCTHVHLFKLRTIICFHRLNF